MKLWMAMVMAMLLIGVEHWFPWRKLRVLQGRNRPPRRIALVFGILAMGVPLAAFFISQSDFKSVIGLMVTSSVVVATLDINYWAEEEKPPLPVEISKMRRLKAFVLHILVWAGQLTWLFLTWGNSAAVLALWSVIISAGAATGLVYAGDWLLDVVREKDEAEEREAKLVEK